MILVWPCKTCKEYSTNPDGCALHAPPRPEGETFEEELLRALTAPLDSFPEGGIPISGMTFPGPYDICTCTGNECCSNCP